MYSKSLVLTAFTLAAAMEGPAAQSQTPSVDFHDAGSGTAVKKGSKAGNDEGGLAAFTSLPYCDGVLATHSLPFPNDYFGAAVAMSGNTLLVGAPGRDVEGQVNNGGAHFMVRSGANWVQTSGLGGGWGGAALGCSVALRGDHAVIGSRYDQTLGTNAGAAATMHRVSPTTWLSGGAPLTAWDGVPGDEFGAKVAMGTDWIAVSAPFKASGNTVLAGKVYAFRRFGTSWGWDQDFMLTLPTAGDTLGISLAMHGNMLAAGATGRTVAGHSDAGTVLVAEANLISQNPFAANWNKSVVTANDAAPDDHFGTSVALSDSFLYVGAPDVDIPGNANAGAIYVFQRTAFNTWQQVTRITGYIANQRLGREIAVDGQNIIVSDGAGTIRRYKQPAPNVSLTPICVAIRPKPAGMSSSYGGALTISGADVALGDAHYDLTASDNQGAVHILAASANDNCSNAISISHGVYQGCTLTATNDGSSPCGSSVNSTDVWYTLAGTPGNTGPWILSLNSDFDTVMSAHTGLCPGSTDTSVACNDDGNGNWDARLNLNVSAGQTYLIRVTGFLVDVGAFKLFARRNICPADIAPAPLGDQLVDVNDLLMVITRWGPCPGTPDLSPCDADIAGANHAIDVNDLLAVITTWGACP